MRASLHAFVRVWICECVRDCERVFVSVCVCACVRAVCVPA